MSSYLLIGHWYGKASAAEAAKKAFLVNRVGDFGFMAGILMVWGMAGTVAFGGLVEGLAGNASVSAGLLGAAVLLIFCGAAGKSAQAPLHVWLPDAMEGPTPVSALIHAATMVAAGVYMMVRFFLSLEGAGGGHGGEAEAASVMAMVPGWATGTIAWVGGITALLAALMATQQDDIKKVLAYSTLSQLGYMVMAVGCLAGAAAMFHLFTHAWFKGLLFLGAGAVIHACHHEQDIWRMGGLFRRMPVTGLAFLLGTAALIAVPGTAGFFSKEQVLAAARGLHPALFWLGAGVAAVTAFYMTRLFLVAFLGKARDEGAEHAKEVEPVMWLPLVALAVLAVAAGLPALAEELSPLFHEHEFHAGLVFFASLGALAVGVAAAFALYKGRDEEPLRGNAVARLFANKFYIDEFYGKLVGYGQDAVAAVVHFLDELVIGSLCGGGSAWLAKHGLGGVFRRMQSGSLGGYAAAFGAGALVVIFIMVFG